jgi:Zn-dependent protease with chaperone function
MNFTLMLSLVLLATFGVGAVMLSGLVVLAWRAGLDRRCSTTADLLTLRLLPVAGAVLIALTVVLPGFLSYEPRHEREAAGPLLCTLAAFAAFVLTHGLWRGWRACLAAQALLRSCGPVKRRLVENGQEIKVIDVPEPIVAVIGSWRPELIAAECVVCRCSTEEFHLIIAHEAAHVSTRDNLKQLLLLASPDVLAFAAFGETLISRWRAAAEREADQRAAGSDPHRRVALAGALLKVARAFSTIPRKRAALFMPVACDDIEGRVRQLLAPPDACPAGKKSGAIVMSCLLLLPLAALPFYPVIHRLIEELVRIGL